MMTDKRIGNDGKDEAKITVISQINDYEVEMTSMVCSDWLKEKTYQQKMSNTSMELMEEAQYEVRKDDGRYMVNETTKGSEVTEARKREEDQRIHTQNLWMVDIFMLMYFLVAYVTGNLNC